MPLESLLELVETLRERIDEHGAALRQSEALTRAALIDPLLRELGWDTGDPAMVVPEDTSGQGRADYVLRTNGRPIMVIEAKKLDSGLQDGARQAVDYAMDARRQARYFAITDGQSWEIYDTNRPAREMNLVSFEVRATSTAEVCLKTIALWRPAVEQGSVMAAETPIAGLDTIGREATEADASPPIPVPEPTPPHQPAFRRTSAPVTQPDETGQEWIPLSELKPQSRSKPAEILLPDNSRVSASSWAQVIAKLTYWLHTNNYLDEGNWRIRRNTRYLVSDTPVHPNGKEFAQSNEAGGLYVETNYSASDHAKNARIIIEYVGRDPSQFKVRLSS